MNFLILASLALCMIGNEIGEVQKPNTYVAQYTKTPIVIDGLPENAWDQVSWSAEFVDIEGVIKPTYKTQFKILWDSTKLYFLARLQEPHVWGDIEERDAVIFYNNDFEIFMDPDGDTHNYMEFEMNALNTVWDLYLTKPYRNQPKVLDAWDITGIQTAVSIQGTLNDPSDEDEGWTVEIAMPWSGITEGARHEGAPVNESWRINFSRVNWQFDLENGQYARAKKSDGSYLPEYNWVWSPQGVINMHEPEHWGFVYFAKTSDATFEPPIEEDYRRALYGLYRQIRGQADQGKMAENLSVAVKGQLIPVSFEYHIAGWNISLVVPESQTIVCISEDGKSSININQIK